MVSRSRFTYRASMEKGYGFGERIEKPMSNIKSDTTKNHNELMLEEIEKESLRASQLESLLDAFQSAVTEKEQLITLEFNILQQMQDVSLKVTDESILTELDLAIQEKSTQIAAERQICVEITDVAAVLESEINASGTKMSDLRRSLDSSSTSEDLQSMAEWARARDERVLMLINQFNEITRKKGLNPADASVPDNLAGYIGGAIDDTGVSLTMGNAGTTIAIIAEGLKAKSNSEIAAMAGSAVGATGTALVAVTSRWVLYVQHAYVRVHCPVAALSDSMPCTTLTSHLSPLTTALHSTVPH